MLDENVGFRLKLFALKRGGVCLSRAACGEILPPKEPICWEQLDEKVRSVSLLSFLPLSQGSQGTLPSSRHLSCECIFQADEVFFQGTTGGRRGRSADRSPPQPQEHWGRPLLYQRVFFPVSPSLDHSHLSSPLMASESGLGLR